MSKEDCAWERVRQVLTEQFGFSEGYLGMSLHESWPKTASVVRSFSTAAIRPNGRSVRHVDLSDSPKKVLKKVLKALGLRREWKAAGHLEHLRKAESVPYAGPAYGGLCRPAPEKCFVKIPTCKEGL